MQWHGWRGMGPHATTSGVGKAYGVTTGSGETQLVWLLVLLAAVEVVGLGAGSNHGWLQGELLKSESPRGELGCVGGDSHH